MNKIEELLESIVENRSGYICDLIYYDEPDIKVIMKEYAEYYAQKCLEIAAEKANVFWEGDINHIKNITGSVSFKLEREYITVSPNKQSILNIELPEHN